MTKEVFILIVDDEPSHRLLIRRSLKEHDVRNKVMEVEDGQQAFDYVYGRGKYADRKLYPSPDLILLDINMPKFDGFEVLEKLKSDPATQYIPIVMLTSSSREEEISRGYDYGANAYVTKPVDFAEFSKKLKSLNIFWTLTAETPPHN